MEIARSSALITGGASGLGAATARRLIYALITPSACGCSARIVSAYLLVYPIWVYGFHRVRALGKYAKRWLATRAAHFP